MKKLIALIAAALFALLAAAPAVGAPDSCMPAAAKYIRVIEMKPNWIVWWWCADGRYQWTPIIPGDFTADKMTASMRWAFGFDPGYMQGPPSRPVDDPLMVQMAAAALAMATADADRPPAPAGWSVAKNAAYPDRPTYPVTNGVRGTKSDGRVNVGTVCDCSTPIVEGRTTYCPRAGATPGGMIPTGSPAPTSVAVCVRGP